MDSARGSRPGCLLLGLVMLGFARSVGAFPLAGTRGITITGHVSSQVSLRTEDSDSGGRACLASLGATCRGFTFPTTKAGQLVQHRSLLDLEWTQDLRRWQPALRVLDQFDYRLRVKYFYDGVYDYGPAQFGNPGRVANPNDAAGLRAARHADTQHDPLWNAYVDLAKSRAAVRIGRQDLSWGETDGFRLLDQIEPLDSRFGFPLVEDLDDRRIPLWMVRSTVGLGRVGPISDLTFDGFWVPGTIDDQIAPLASQGNPFAVGNPPGEAITIRPSKNLGNSRGGGRLLGLVGQRVTVSIAHYVTYNDLPSARLRVDAIGTTPVPGGVLLTPQAPFLLEYYQQQITGGSATTTLPFDPYTVLRTEVAQFWDERVFIPQDNVLSAANAFNPAHPTPTLGQLPTKNVLRWMVGIDRNVWLRWLNPASTFFISAQYFHTHIFNYEQELANPVVSATERTTVAPGVFSYNFDFVPRLQDEVIFTYLVSTLYWHGRIAAQIFGAYDLRGVHTIVPSLTYQIGSDVQLVMKYAVITGTYANLGFFRDRDELVWRVQYNLP